MLYSVLRGMDRLKDDLQVNYSSRHCRTVNPEAPDDQMLHAGLARVLAPAMDLARWRGITSHAMHSKTTLVHTGWGGQV